MPKENEYKWYELIPEVDPDPDGKREQTDVVVSVIGRMVGTDGVNKATVDARVMLPEPDAENYIEHRDLTPEWLEEICEEANGELFRMAIDRQLAEIRLRPKVKLLPSQLPKEEEPAE